SRGIIVIQDLRQEDHAVEVGAVLGLEHVDEIGRAWGAVALAEKVLGRVPAAVLGEELHDELGEGMHVLVGAEEFLLGAWRHPREAGTRRVDEYEVARIEEAVV